MTTTLAPPVFIAAATVPRTATAPPPADPWHVCANLLLGMNCDAVAMARSERRAATLAAKLDDPALLADWPHGCPERAAAESRHFALAAEAKRLRRRIGDDGRRLDRVWQTLNATQRDDLQGCLAAAWQPSPLWDAVRSDQTLRGLPAWRALLATQAIAIVEEAPF